MNGKNKTSDELKKAATEKKTTNKQTKKMEVVKDTKTSKSTQKNEVTDLKEMVKNLVEANKKLTDKNTELQEKVKIDIELEELLEIKQRKQMLIKNKTQFVDTQNILIEISKELNEPDSIELEEPVNYQLCLYSYKKDKYKADTLFSVSKNFVIKETCLFIADKITGKVEDLEKEIEAVKL